MNRASNVAQVLLHAYNLFYADTHFIFTIFVLIYYTDTHFIFTIFVSMSRSRSIYVVSIRSIFYFQLHLICH